MSRMKLNKCGYTKRLKVTWFQVEKMSMLNPAEQVHFVCTESTPPQVGLSCHTDFCVHLQ